eukprot:CAMPEP_0168335506 /NCGR_PEP_ID=MMETSP0213-20121227/10952_1 /TAXON_ID=151035 /ORGANISM="Euplotes harpa, Strain FSP1.4" /LENGTH=417 /DNA_ID=CAMNT_0008340451 /DNA_START=14 /DNA_END=1267 /DNA_ORIENTATION=+
MKVATIFVLALLAFTVSSSTSDHWAVLVAGSNGYWNYRHQADICHAYQIMLGHGIPAEQIIVFAYDDIAQNSQNPFKGQIFNKPDGKDVYAGCNIDYKGADVNPAKFLSVIKGEGSGKVLKSNSNSKVFINFSDHGAPGLIAFPSQYLYATDFHNALLAMKEKQMYNEMTIYIEACESGSMFENILEDNINIYATTAANPSESSWAFYCSPADVVNGKHIGSCLGDEYSIQWMEDTDANNICSESLSTQFGTVQTNTHDSHVMKYGSQGFTSEPVGNFQGTCDSQASVKGFLREMNRVKPSSNEMVSSIDSRYAKVHYLFTKYMTTHATEDAEELEKELQYRRRVDERFAAVRSLTNLDFTRGQLIGDWDCYKNLIDTYESKCGVDEYDLGFFNHFVSMCNSNLSFSQMVSIVTQDC